LKSWGQSKNARANLLKRGLAGWTGKRRKRPEAVACTYDISSTYPGDLLNSEPEMKTRISFFTLLALVLMAVGPGVFAEEVTPTKAVSATGDFGVLSITAVTRPAMKP
jgi:hypothetical protein